MITRGTDQVERMLAAGDALAKTPRISFAQRNVVDMQSGSLVQLLHAGHPYRWITCDTGLLGTVILSFAQSSGLGLEQIALHDGAWFPIDDRDVYATFQPNSALAFTDSDQQNQALRFAFYTGDSPPTRQPGNVLPVATGLHTPSANAPTSISAGNTGVAILGHNFVTILFAGAAGEIAAETGDYEVWWKNGITGIWVHNDSDDFDGAGRGSVSSTHTVEVYHVPHNFTRVFVRTTAGGVNITNRFIMTYDKAGG